jgi:hypothetical protein
MPSTEAVAVADERLKPTPTAAEQRAAAAARTASED